MSDEKTLKQENLRYVQAYTIFLVVIFWWLAQGLSIQEVLDSAGTANDWLENLLSATFFATIAYVTTIILSGLLPSKAKYILVFWRLKYILPGHRAFSQLMDQDPRIDSNSLIERYGQLPQDPKIQNKLWYCIYKEYEMNKTVLEAQKSFLLMREITAITAILIPVFIIIGLFFVSDWHYFTFYILALLLLAIFAATAGRNYGERLVLNVMAVASTR
jgi:hypothetical protein